MFAISNGLGWSNRSDIERFETTRSTTRAEIMLNVRNGSFQLRIRCFYSPTAAMVLDRSIYSDCVSRRVYDRKKISHGILSSRATIFELRFARFTLKSMNFCWTRRRTIRRKLVSVERFIRMTVRDNIVRTGDTFWPNWIWMDSLSSIINGSAAA